MSKTATDSRADRIQRLISRSEVESAKMGQKTLVVCCTLPSGFEIVESAACVDPADFDEEIGLGICMQQIESRIWELEGYRDHIAEI